MSVYMTEEEQLDAIRRWWAKYGNVITVLVSLIMLSFAGYKYFNWHQEKVTEQASVVYENMMSAYSQHNIKSVRAYANELTSKYNHSIYADAAQMILAKLYIDKNKLAQARSQLQSVAHQGKMPALQQIATIRLARILASEHSYQQALNELDSVKDIMYTSVIHELKGDIYSALKNYKEAMNFYHLAIDDIKSNGLNNNLFLEMKANELANTIPATNFKKV